MSIFHFNKAVNMHKFVLKAIQVFQNFKHMHRQIEQLVCVLNYTVLTDHGEIM